MTVRAGPGGAVIAALPHSAVARLARAHPHVYAHVATELARRLRPALPARLWDRCGAEWCALRTGEALVNSARGMSHAGRHPEGVYVVATGCVRLAGDPAGSTHGDGGHSNGHSADHPHPHASSVNSAMGHGVTDDGEGEAGVTRARFLGPGEAVGEDTVLRGVDGEAYGESGGFGRGNSGLKGPSRNGRDRGEFIFGYFWLFLVIFGNLRTGNSLTSCFVYRYTRGVVRLGALEGTRRA
jgi:CRP-like cAMP-binding protein